MKGKFKLLGHIGLALFLVSALILTLAPVAQAATEVTEVWVDFEDADSQNAIASTSNVYLVHFKATTALSRGVDTVTVTWPDGSTAMGSYTFTVATTMTAGEVDFSTNYESTARSANITWTDCTVTPTVGGTRSKVTTPIDVAAGQDVWIRFASNDIESGSTAGGTYKVYVSTSQDTTPVLSSAFGLSGTVLAAAPAITISPASAGASSEYVIDMTDDIYTTLVVDTDTVTVQFPVGTTLPSSITASNVQFGTSSSDYTATGTTPTVDQDKRTITAVTSKGVDGTTGTLFMKITSAAGVTNPTEAATTGEVLYYLMCCTSKDRQFKLSGAYAVTAGAAVAVKVCDGEVGLDDPYYSDNATMINMYSSTIYVTLVDVYGNAKAVSGGVTITPSASSGTLYKNAHVLGTGNYSSASTLTVDAATPDVNQAVFFKGATAGTHTLTFAADAYTNAELTFTVCPGVSLYDSSNNLIKTYGPTATVLAAEATTSDSDVTDDPHFGSDFINDAITAAMAGDTVKLGDGIYELDTTINLNKKITLTSVNGAASTTLRPTKEELTSPFVGPDVAIYVGITGTATNPVIIDGLTFTRLRLDTEFDIAIWNNGFDYVTVRNCVFNYIIPTHAEYTDGAYGAVVSFLAYAAGGALPYAGGNTITSGTISNNTFTNCCTFGFDQYGQQHANISVMAKDTGTSKTITGVTVSGNTLTDCNGIGIFLKGYYATDATVTASVTDNTITNAVYPISVQGYTTGCSILRNTITGGYQTGLWVEPTEHISLVIKNNTFTGIAGTGCTNTLYDVSCAIGLWDDGTQGDPEVVSAVTVQYNDIYDNDATYSIYAKSDIAGGAQSCQYNYFGDATGPAYTALTGATVTKSNTGGTGDSITDLVTYYPWLHKPLADVVADNASYQASTMKLVSGWNTLSTPVKLISTADSIDELMPSGTMEIGYYYDATGWHQITTGYVLNACDAVYVKMNAATYVLLKFDASAYTTPSKSLAAGWNMVSLAYLASAGELADDAVASVALTAAGLPGYAQVVSPSLNATQTDMFGAAGSSWAVSYGQATVTDRMYAGLGYWCYMQNAATLAGFEITPIAPDLD